MRKNYFIWQILASLVIVLICSTGFALARVRAIESVSFLMAAPFADATKDLVKQFNQEHRGEINLRVIRGPLETDAMSDLAISSLLY